MLPNPSEYHPVTKARNIAAAGAMYDTSVRWVVLVNLDRSNYDKQKEAYLVQWCGDEHRFGATWVWASTLFQGKFPSTHTASKDGKCFFKAIRIACHVAGGPDLVPYSLIGEFEDKQEAKGLKEGVPTGDPKLFLAFLRE
ncbi:hypothetical protein GN244_ATG11845 [Phytophthora infestans]|uniref:Uncharacterized protein n=1 Tax=Phytophthora infestans TaxID=4787 RepID=A0A833SP54_PHYIN|nr:hypothetical protein GN244_ATG11845 [Phytophthora infestans]